MIILEFDYFTAVHTDEVIVRRLIQKVRVVGGLSVAEVDFLKQSCLHEQADSPVESRPRCTGVGSPELFPQFIRREVFIGGKNNIHDCIALRGLPQALSLDEGVESFLNL